MIATTSSPSSGSSTILSPELRDYLAMDHCRAAGRVRQRLLAARAFHDRGGVAEYHLLVAALALDFEILACHLPTSRFELDLLGGPSTDDALLLLLAVVALQDELLALPLLLDRLLARPLASVAGKAPLVGAVALSHRPRPALAGGLHLMHFVLFAIRTIGVYLFREFHASSPVADFHSFRGTNRLRMCAVDIGTLGF